MSREMSIEDAAQKILATPAPVLLLDTCAVLDVIRGPEYRTMESIEPARDLAAGATAPVPALYVVAAPCIPEEWSKNVLNITTKLEKYIDDMDNRISRIHEFFRLAHCPIKEPPAEYSSLALQDSLVSIAEGLLDAAIRLERNDECGGKAHIRTMRCLPPSDKGQQPKDCDIIEHYIALCHNLSTRSFAPKVVLVSGNVRDFCESKCEMHASLLKEFSGVKFSFTTDLAWAKSELGL